MSQESHEYTRRNLLRVAGSGLAVVGASSMLQKVVLAQAPGTNGQPGGVATIPNPNRATGQEFPKLQDPLPEPPDGRVGYAVVGLGQFALNQILPSFGESRKSKLVALVSGDAQKAQQVGRQYGIAPNNLYTYANFDQIKNNPQIQVVYVIVPNSLHPEFTIRAAAAGKHVLCEKPIATNSADARRMIDACRNANRKLMTAYRAQYEPFNLEAIRVARSGELGRIISIVADHGRTIEPNNPADQWRIQKAIAGGGPLPDVGIYSLNATRYLTGEEPTEISAMLVQPTNDPRFREVEQSVHWTMRFPSGVLANCTTSYNYQDTKRYQVLFENGTLTLDPATDYYRHRMEINRKRQGGGSSNPAEVVEYESVQEVRPIVEKNQFALMMDHFSECVLENKNPKTPGEEGLRDIRLIELIYEAARTGRTVKV